MSLAPQLGRSFASEHQYEPSGDYSTFVPRDPRDRTRIAFETSNERVDYIRAGRLPQVEFVEGCA